MKKNKLYAGTAEVAKRAWAKPAPVKYPTDSWRWARFMDAKAALRAARNA